MSAPRGLQVLSIFASYGAAGVFWGALAASAPALQARAGLGDAAFGAALGIMALAALPVMRRFGRALHRIEAWAIPVTLGALGFGAGLTAALPGLSGLLVAFAVIGAASGALDIALNARTARLESDFGLRLFNRTHALFPAASLMSSAATGWARSEGVAPGTLFTLIAAVLIAAAVLERVAGGHIAPPAPETAPPEPARLTGALALLALIAAAAAFQEAASQGWAAIFVERVRDAGALAAGLAPAAYTLGLSTGRLIAHALEDSLRNATVLRASAVIAAVGFVAIPLSLPMPATLLAFFIAGVGTGPVEPAVFRAVASRSTSPGPALASVTAVAYIGYLVSPPALGVVAEGAGFTTLWIMSAIIALVIGALALRLGRPTRSGTD